MTKPGDLQPFSKSVANLAIQDVNLLGATAYAEAALHHAERSMMSPDYELTSASLEAVTAAFEGTEQETLIEDAFRRAYLIIEARSLDKPNPDERAFLLAEHGDAMEGLRQKVAAAVEQRTLPLICLTTLDSAIDIAKIEQPKREWVQLASQRDEWTAGIRGKI